MRVISSVKHSQIVKLLYYLMFQGYYFLKLRKLRKKIKINVVFFVIHTAVWKYESLFRIFLKDTRFHPLIVVCPDIRYGEVWMLETMEETFRYFKDRGYTVINSYLRSAGKWLDVKKELKPDIIFFTNPHPLTRDEYYIYNFTDVLTCYTQYSFHVSSLQELQYNQKFHNLLWRQFCETKYHKGFSRQFSSLKGINCVLTGYPGIDEILSKDYIPKEVWKARNEYCQRIIWAPHHTIHGEKGILDYSNFLTMAEFMLELAIAYSGKIQFAFKPHPMLRKNLESLGTWGFERTRSYYQRWENLGNGQLNEDGYVDLFLKSDALIHDSGSFLAEYLFTNKPSLFITKSEVQLHNFNEFGDYIFDLQYHTSSTQGIINFIEEVVINGHDPLKIDREKFINGYIQSLKSESASRNIYNYIKNRV